jgi:hypothetical protein
MRISQTSASAMLRVLGDVARLVEKDRVSLNNVSIMALLMFYYKKSRRN